MDGQLVTLGNAPAHIAQGGGLKLNAAAQAGIPASFAVLKIKNKVFRVRFQGKERVIEASAGVGHDGRPLPVAPVPTLDVIIVGMSSAISKRFYIGGFTEGGEAKAPDCFSINGTTPDPSAINKQNNLCETCPKNVWGSATSDVGTKLKACQDRRRVALVPAADAANVNDGGPMLLDIPPATLRILDRYARSLDQLGADMSQVITRIGFNPDKTLELTFSSVGWVTDPRAFDTAVEHGKSEQVRRMLYEEVIDVATDSDVDLSALGPKPVHLTQARLAPGVQAQQAQDAPVVPPPPAPTPTPPPPMPVPPVTPPPAAAKAAAPTVVQGAPTDLQSQIDAIDALLSTADC